MNKIKKIVCIILSVIMITQLLAGCTVKKTDDEIYLTKGEFFSYYVYENRMTSMNYNATDIENCKDGSVEASIIAEWGYLTEDQALKGLKSAATKEIVVMVCANATYGLVEGNVNDIKDADLLDDPQIIANAYASGFFDLNNGYFDGAKKMSLSDCEEIMEKANAYTSNFHFETNTEKTTVAEDVYVQDDSDYTEGDIVISFNESDYAESPIAYSSTDKLEVTPLNYLGYDENIIDLNHNSSDANLIQTANGKDDFANISNVQSFMATINKNTYEKSLGKPKVGDKVVLKRADLLLTNDNFFRNNPLGTIIGELLASSMNGNTYVCQFAVLEFEPAVKAVNVEEANRNGIDTTTFVALETNVDGWELKFNVTSADISVSAKKAFTHKETGRKQDWQNAKQTVNASVDFKIGDFNVDACNLKSFATKKGTGFVKMTCDSSMGFSLDQSLRYTPDSNRNGKFPSNWNTSRWTDSDSKGAKEIKIARFCPTVYGIVGANIYIYIRISVDGKISFTSSVDNGGVQITTNNGNISTRNLGTKEEELKLNVNLHGRLGVDASINIFTFINVIRYDVGLDANLNALTNLYYEDSLKQKGLYADAEGLDDYSKNDSKFNYCIGICLDIGLSGKLLDSGVKLILDWISKGSNLDFSVDLWSCGFHFEDGNFVDKCTRGDDIDASVEKSEDESICLETYKVILDDGASATINITELPSKSFNLVKSKKSVTVSSKNNKVCNVQYNKNEGKIIVEALNPGSTEITIKAKKGILFWKETYEQELSVTVNDSYVQDFVCFTPNDNYVLIKNLPVLSI